jgi:hypothetical protein
MQMEKEKVDKGDEDSSLTSEISDVKEKIESAKFFFNNLA